MQINVRCAIYNPKFFRFVGGAKESPRFIKSCMAIFRTGNEQFRNVGFTYMIHRTQSFVTNP